MRRSKFKSTDAARAAAALLAALAWLTGCSETSEQKLEEPEKPEVTTADTERQGKPVVYQAFTRLFGNTRTTNLPWGTIEQNGVGKFADFTPAALTGIRELGVTHIWFTGVPHHALVGDYSAYGIDADDPDVVKGRAGSPYAVKDYYSVNPDLAVDPARRLEEFEALVARAHVQGLRVLIDIVPNHVARHYRSVAKPDGVRDFGADDDTSVAWARDNNFYYIIGQDFRVPEWPESYLPLGGEDHPAADGVFRESPARWTGNGSRGAQPQPDDWYETVKVNYGVRPDGSYDFDRLPDEARAWTDAAHANFWANRVVPDSWVKFRDIALYWTAKGVDGFRYDMAELVPVEFWSYLNSAIKAANSDAFLLAEVYNPALYRDYLQLGRMDYLYDKVELYDSLKAIIRGESGTDSIPRIQNGLADIEAHMLHFLENHDEQRIASPAFAGDANLARPAMVVSATISRSPTMIYFGQEVGEAGAGDAGFGDPTRTTIFDYWGVPAHQRWMNGGEFDGGALSDDERELRDFYRRLLNLSANQPAMRGTYRDLHETNRANTPGYTDRQLAFLRYAGDERLIVVSNFSVDEAARFELLIPDLQSAALADGRYVAKDLLYGEQETEFTIAGGAARLPLTLAPLESLILRIE